MADRFALLRRLLDNLPAKMKRFLRSQRFYTALIIFAGSLAVLLISLIAATPTRYQLAVGMVPPYTISATRDVVDEITTEQHRAAAAAAVTPTYKFQEGVTDAVIKSLEDIQAELSAVRQYAMTLSDYSPTKKYTAEELDYASSMVTLVDIHDYKLITLLNTTQEQYDEMFTSLISAVRNTMQSNVTQGQEATAITSIMQIIGFRTNVSLLQNVVQPVLAATIKPNMIIDQEATEKARQEAREHTEPVVYKQGQNIVVRGEGRVKENDISMLNALGLLSDNSIDAKMYLGSFILIYLVLTAMAAAVYAAYPTMYHSNALLSLYYILFFLATALCYLAKVLQLTYAAPLILMPMLVTVLIGCVPALIGNLFFSIIAALLLNSWSVGSTDAFTLLTLSLVSGTFSALFLKKKTQRSMILIAGASTSVLSFLIVLGIGLASSAEKAMMLNKALLAVAGGLVSMLFCLALQPLCESLFNLPTANRLLDLSNPNRPLLRRLMLEAPGTYHHSIILANLAEASAEAIHANTLLTRVGAYYHDIGKLKNPRFFKENQIGSVNVHDTKTPMESADIIRAHVDDGIALAKQYRLPAAIQRIIAEHHGNSMIAYFYAKALKEATPDTIVDEALFRYGNSTPQTAESAIIMICDTVEAAVRASASHKPDDMRKLIDSLIMNKIDDNQLTDSPLTMKNLQDIREACVSVLSGVFHERIAYPQAAIKSAGTAIKSHLTKAFIPQQPDDTVAPTPEI